MDPTAAPAERRRTRSAEETERLGAALAPALVPGDVIVLRGPLGAGKTRFVAGIARGIGAPARVRSPSFTLVNEYRGDRLLLHLDLYRLEPEDVAALGLEERLEEAVLAVEWGEKLPPRLRRDALTLAFEIVSERERAIAATGAGPRGCALAEAWRGMAAPR